MKLRFASRVLSLVVVSLLLALSLSAVSRAPSSPDAGTPLEGGQPSLPVGAPLAEVQARPVARPAQPGLARVLSESFESANFPPSTSKWSTADRCAIFPGQGDVVKWGRTTCDASNGRASLWAVGGGSVGSTLACGATYPPTVQDARRTPGCNTIDTLLRYFSFDASTVAYGLRVTFDYKAKMPEGALRIAIGTRSQEGNITFTQEHRDFQADTGGEWVRGVVREFTEARNVKQLVVGIFYVDDTHQAGMQGAFIDNMHFDMLLADNVPLRGSPTAEVTNTPTPTRTPTTPSIISPTTGPSPTRTRTRTPVPTPTPRRIVMPAMVKRFDMLGPTVPVMTVPPPTPTRTDTPTVPPPTDTPEPTGTDRPTRTPRPSETPTRTPYPTPTDIPKPVIRIVEVSRRSLTPGESLEYARVENSGTADQPLAGWRLFNKSHSRTCRFPAEVVLAAGGGTYDVRSGADAVADATGMICSDGYIWDDKKDEAQLYNEFNLMMACFAYDENGVYDCMPTD